MIIGIDPGFNKLGYALVEGSKRDPQIIDYGIIETHKGDHDSFESRLLEIGNDLEQILAKKVIKKAIVEDLFFFKNQKTALKVAHVRGLIMFLLKRQGIEIMSLTPLQVKQGLCGYGRATKKQVQTMVQRVYKLDQIPQPDDAADSLGMAWLGLS